MSGRSEREPQSPSLRPPGFGPRGMGMPVEKARNAKGTLFRLVAYFRPYRWRLFLVFLATLLTTAFSIVSPKIMGNATTVLFHGFLQKVRGLPGGGVDFGAIARLLVILGCLYLLSSIFNYVQQWVMAGVTQQAVYDLRRRVDEKLARLPVRFFDTHPHGEVLSRFVNDFDNISSTLQQSLTQFIQAVVTFFGVTVMMLSISRLMTLVVAMTLPLSFILTKTLASRSQKFFLARQRDLGELNGHVEEMYTGHLVVKAFGHEPAAIDAFDAINQRLFESSWKAQFITGVIFPLMNFIGNLGYVLVCVIGGILVTLGRIQIGDILAFIQYSRQFSQPMAQLSSISNVIQSTLASAERVFELLDEEEEPDEADGVIENPRGDVRFASVRFGYRPDQLLIGDLSVAAQSGQTIAVVGPTGAGKTTLVNLLMRFYDPQGGYITIDGVDIVQLRRENLRRMFGMVLQDTWLFYGTIGENIAYGRQGATATEVVGAAKTAQADHFIRTLPQGYDTMLNEEASNLSQGQKQLLTVARAILADPAILILDEATSSVDTRTEVLIQRAMHLLMQGRTSFVIAHRLSTIREADQILVMNRGRLVEQGRHHELLERGGFYAELYQSQFRPSAMAGEGAVAPIS